MAIKKKKAKKAPKKKALKKRVIKKKAVRKAAPKKKAVRKTLPRKKKASGLKAKKEGVLGVVTHYFPKVQAAVIKLKAPLLVGESIKIKGHTTDFTQPITSMQIDHVPVNEAKKGQEIGLLVKSRVRQHDTVYKA